MHMHIFFAEAKDINLILLTCFSFRLFKLNWAHLDKNLRDEYKIGKILWALLVNFLNSYLSIYLKKRSS